MNKLTKHISLALVVVISFAGCNDFGDMNKDPNNVSTARTELLLTNAQKSVSDLITLTYPVMFVQYMSTTQYDQNESYSNTGANFNGYYTSPLKDLTEIIELNQADPATYLEFGSTENQIAVARILKAYMYHNMVDIWGPLPYSEALLGADNYQPAYDDATSIYSALINELKEASTQINVSSAPVKGDIIFEGDMSQWIKFANTIRARLALRLADVSPSIAKSEFENAASNLITNDVMYKYLAETANQNPWYAAYITRNDFAISDVMDDFMTPKGDLRLTAYANPAADVDNGDGVTQMDEVIGMPYSILDAGSITAAAVSYPGKAIGAGGPNVGIQDAPLPIVTMSEVHFMLAEASARGWSVSGDAPTHYELAIKASWEQWDVFDENAFSTYMTHQDVIYDAANYKKSIGEQKWVALYPLGQEAWSEWRRLGYPVLTPHEFANNPSGEIPVRMRYPSSELTLNASSYQNALSKLGGPDDDQTPIFWDVD